VGEPISRKGEGTAGLLTESLIASATTATSNRDRGSMEVRARAPGKIILAGEHAVVHGSAAVAAAIDLYTTSSLRLLPAGDPRSPWIRFLILRHCCRSHRPHLGFFLVLRRRG